jgi:hypothetical protein
MTTSTRINYYVFDRIEKEENGANFWGYLGNDFCEVFPLGSEDTESELIKSGFAKCDAPGTETFVVEETAWTTLKK